jgi:hypothetical protein
MGDGWKLVVCMNWQQGYYSHLFPLCPAIVTEDGRSGGEKVEKFSVKNFFCPCNLSL